MTKNFATKVSDEIEEVLKRHPLPEGITVLRRLDGEGVCHTPYDLEFPCLAYLLTTQKHPTLGRPLRLAFEVTPSDLKEGKIEDVLSKAVSRMEDGRRRVWDWEKEKIEKLLEEVEKQKDSTFEEVLQSMEKETK